jgi:NAD(P)-dependent dehydrogenase (short-subunit alcohol dehydrogenase family)
MSDDDWQWTFDLVLRHAFLVAQIGGRALVEGGGGVLAFVASISGLTSSPMHAPYGAAKAALMSLVRSVAVEIGPKGVRVNAVAPGGTLTPRMLEVLSADAQEAAARAVPSRRMAVPPDLAGALLFTVSDLASYVNGQVLVLDGGGHQSFPYSVEHFDE